MNNKPILAIAAVVAAAALAIWYGKRQPVDHHLLVLYGNVDVRQVSLAFNGSERVDTLNVQEGDHVKTGQVLGELDTRTLKLHAAQAQAQIEVQYQALQRLKSGSRPEEVAEARAKTAADAADFELAAQQLERQQAIHQATSGRAVSAQDIDNAVARQKVTQAQLKSSLKAQRLVEIGPRKEDIAQAEAQLKVARSELALVNHQIAESELKAPLNAVVRARLLEPGDMASPLRPVFTLAITDPKWVRAYVNEVDLGRIKPGVSASVTSDSHPSQPLSGKVGYISSVAEFTPKTVQTEELRTNLVYEVRVLVDDAGDRLRLGMPATVRIALHDDATPAAAAH